MFDFPVVKSEDKINLESTWKKKESVSFKCGGRDFKLITMTREYSLFERCGWGLVGVAMMVTIVADLFFWDYVKSFFETHETKIFLVLQPNLVKQTKLIEQPSDERPNLIENLNSNVKETMLSDLFPPLNVTKEHYEDKIAEIKNQIVWLDRLHAYDISKLEENHAKELEFLNEDHIKEIEDLEKEYDKKILKEGDSHREELAVKKEKLRKGQTDELKNFMEDQVREIDVCNEKYVKEREKLQKRLDKQEKKLQKL